MQLGVIHSGAFPSLDADVVQIVQMCRAFAAQGHDVTLFSPRSSAYPTDDTALAAARGLFGEQFPFRISFVSSFKILGRLQVIGTIPGTNRKLRETRLDLAYTLNPYSLPSLHRLGVPWVFEVHETQLQYRSRSLSRILQSIVVHYTRKSTSPFTVAISAALANIWAERGVPKDKLVVAHDAVDLAMFLPNLARSDARAKLNLPPEQRMVIYAGQMTAERGIDMMLEAARELPQLQFYFVGGTEFEDAHWAQVAERLDARNVHFIGRVPHREIPLWLAAGDILLMMWTWQVKTIRGCSPMKMFEYMAAKRLIVGPAFPTILEVLEPGKDAILFEPDNQEALIQALREAVTTLADPTIPDAAYQKVAKDYTWQARCARILSRLSPKT